MPAGPRLSREGAPAGDGVPPNERTTWRKRADFLNTVTQDSNPPPQDRRADGERAWLPGYLLLTASWPALSGWLSARETGGAIIAAGLGLS
ncbi:MAG: hypothetical protein D6744_04035, partial [Planctomycetota bacterium]